MSELNAREYKCFEDIKKLDEDGDEYWSARDLAEILEYAEWRNFTKVIDKAMIACDVSDFNVSYHFVDVTKMIELGKGGVREVSDYNLSRYACYLIVQNGDPRKEVIALGQTYFAIQTHRQEIADRFNLLSEDKKRLVVRGDIKHWNQLLAEAAHDAGVITGAEFAAFQNAGYIGLYGGETVNDIHDRKALSAKEKILDFMGGEELAANLFRITQTESKLKREEICGATEANIAHNTVGRNIRETIIKNKSTLPEELPTPDKSVTEIEKEYMAKLKRKAKEGKLMLDE
jgi:DNA-damage-inducible protein D